MENPNTNCLHGMKCPECGSFGPFRIEATTVVTVYDEGTDETTGFDWNGDSYCECNGCAHSGIVEDFKESE